MSSVTKEQIEKAKQLDLLGYLKQFEPEELVPVSQNEYSTKSHGSLKISKGLWIWNKTGIGGRTALDYLIKVRGMGFVAAVEQLCEAAPFSFSAGEHPPPPAFRLPPAQERCTKVTAYLRWRGLAEALIHHCLETGSLYETKIEHRGKSYHNCVFVGTDTENAPRYAMQRGAFSAFRGEVTGSDKRFGFCFSAGKTPTRLVVCESAIDALSCASLQMEASNFESTAYLSLGGTAPQALWQYLQDHPQMEAVTLALDNDPAGRAATERLAAELDGGKYTVYEVFPSIGKDWNEMLCQCRQTGYRQNHKITQER